MNRLKKRAWTEFIAAGICVLISIIGTLLFAHTNLKGLGYFLIVVIVATPTGLILYVWETKKLRQFDEREKEIIRKAFSAGMMVFSLYLLIISYAAFFLIGGGGTVPVVYMPLMLFSGMFLAQAMESFILLFHCAKEDDE